MKPKTHDIEVITPYLAFEESLRSDFKTSKEVKENPELLYTRGYDPKINYNPHKDKVGITKGAPNAEETIIKKFEIYQYGLEWIPLIIKPLPGFFHKIHYALPRLMDYVVEIDLQSDEFMLISRAGANDGDGAAFSNSSYILHTTECFLLFDYKSMGQSVDLKLEREVFAKDELVFDTFDKFRTVFSKAFSENNAAEGILVGDWTALDGQVPDKIVFGLVNATEVMNPSRIQVPGEFEPCSCTKIQLYINDIPIFKKGHINWQII